MQGKEDPQWRKVGGMVQNDERKGMCRNNTG